MTKAQEKEWAAYSRVHMSRGDTHSHLLGVKSSKNTFLLELRRLIIIYVTLTGCLTCHAKMITLLW